MKSTGKGDAGKKYTDLIKKAIGHETLTGFAARAGISPGNLSRIRKGQVASMATLRKIAAASCGVSYRELALAAGIIDPWDVAPADSDDDAGDGGRTAVRIPYFDDIVTVEPRRADMINRHWDVFDPSLDDDGDLVVFEVKDGAIARLAPGDRVLVDLNGKPREGDVVLFAEGKNEAILRRFSERENRYLLLSDDHKAYPPLSLKKSEVRIYGVIVRAIIEF